MRESFAACLGDNQPNKKCPKGADGPVYENTYNDKECVKGICPMNETDGDCSAGKYNGEKETNPWKKKTACNPR